MEGLLGAFLHLLSYWDKIFLQKRTADRARRIAVSLVLAMGRKTITRANAVVGRDQVDWSADYKIFSRSEWSSCDLFAPIMALATDLIDENVIAVAYDDTLIHKTGKKIKGSSWQRDPLSPPFQCNFVWGMRYLQASLLLPLYNHKTSPSPCRALPIQFEQLPKFKKPRKGALKEEFDKYNLLKKKYNASTSFVKMAGCLRIELDALGCKDKRLLLEVDGSYCNKTCLTASIPRTDIIGRARKNARLCFKSTDENSRRFYDEVSFTPEEIRQNKSYPYSKKWFYYGGDYRAVRFKEIKMVYWKNGTKRKPLRLIVIAPTPYQKSKNAPRYYRNAAYLLTTDLTSLAEILIQKYLDRWQIEVNFREEKSQMGLGEQQLWSDKSIPKAPAFVASIYSALLLSSVLLTKDRRDHKIYDELPKWRNKQQQRPSCFDLLTVIRREILTKLLAEAMSGPSSLLNVTQRVIEKSAA